MTEMIKREFEIRAVNEEERTVEGMAVPYNKTIDLGFLKERYERGVFGEIDNVKLFYSHKEPIGRVIESRDEEDGFYIKAVISKTSLGNDVYELLKDGTLNRFSVGYSPVEDREEKDVTVRAKASLKEVSVVAFPAIEEAHILSVRSEQAETAEKANSNNTKEDISIMSKEEIAPEVAELREAVSLLERDVNVLKTSGKDEGSSVPEFRSYGEYVKAVATSDNGPEIHRVYTGGVHADADVDNHWVKSAIHFVEAKRKAINAFSKAPLPAKGMTVDYLTDDADTLSVTQQVAEGDALAFGKVSFTTASAQVKTYGGYGSLSRQEIERADLPMVEEYFKRLAKAYAVVTESVVRTAVTGAVGTTTSDALASDSYDDWFEFLAVAQGNLEDEDYGIDFLYVSRDVWIRMGKLTGTDGRPLLEVVSGKGSNTVGSLDVRNVSAVFMGYPVIVDGALAANTCIIANRDAVLTLEDGGPFRLSDQNVTTLTNDFSVYGNLAVAVQHPKALIKADVDLVA